MNDYLKRSVWLGFAGVSFLFLLTSCVIDLRPVAQPPLISSFTINGKSLDENAGPIISAPGQLIFKAVVSAQAPLTRITILGAKAGTGQPYNELGGCKDSPCRYEWNVTAADNGAYCIVVEAEDERGSVSTVPYKNSLAIVIPTTGVAIRLESASASTC
ncbi:MAG: hypothetical protein ACRCYY_17880 [Trueperaceae bacterium]